ncbi:MAG: SpoIIE family protein phosphatase [Planctomycetaceae bacterium]|nr:SpoIIE family protein phosphatase [Planctomycetaceae bacterium]
MGNSRAAARIALISTEETRGDAAAWRDTLERALGGQAPFHLSLNTLRTADGAAVQIDAEVAVLFAPAGGDAALAAVETSLQSLERSGGESEQMTATRLVVVSDELAGHPPRGASEIFTNARAHEDLVAFLRGMLSCTSSLREARRELSLLGRIVSSMRGELEERNEELQLAALVQRDFLPEPLPPLHGVRVTSLYRPLAQVSGDVFSIEQVDDDQLSIFLADAVGHGIPAALLGMAVCRSLETTERTGAALRVLGPCETLARANARLVAQQRSTTRFATAIAALLDCRTRRMRLAIAGHPAAVLLRPGAAPRTIEVDGGLLGVFPDEYYNEVEVELEPNDRLLFYSDGFEQAFNDGGQARHIEEFGELSGVLDPEELVQRLGARLDAHSGSLHQQDDLTLLCISVEESAALRVAA